MAEQQHTDNHVQSLPEMVYQRLRSGVLKGEFPPGQILRQEELAQRFGASRVPLREAMTRLETEGLLELRPRRGYAVISLEPEEIQEIFALRAIIEGHAGAAAALARTDKDIKAVKALLLKMEKVSISTPEKANAWLELNSAFHDRIFLSAGLRHVSRVALMLRDMVEPYIRIEIGLTMDVAEAQVEHRQIFDALVAGDSERLGHLSKIHCEHTAARLIKAL
ncbi:GntR family transcriptional regulator [Parapusillimonas granuli]|nr:GntR family transcriptional regulator [Parapusillimonas granuli]MBB5216605.1 DNA-binding GntR family transcriptional regulator [Parapusillimonas granuli]